MQPLLKIVHKCIFGFKSLSVEEYVMDDLSNSSLSYLLLRTFNIFFHSIVIFFFLWIHKP
jgi:hypothetical protein